MASLKRKDAPGGAPKAKFAKTTRDSRSSKPHDRTKAPKKHQADEESRTDKLTGELSGLSEKPIITRLKDEAPMFPRGGGSVLTPLEKKQIHMQAKADAFREDELEEEGKGKAIAKRKRKAAAAVSTASKGSKKTAAVVAESSVKIESLNFKRLVKGSLVLCQIVEINPLDLVVALPNNLTGHVPITAISESLSSRLQDKMEESGSEGDEDDIVVDLASIYHIGQYLRASVVSTIDEVASGKPKRRIELSLRPEDANSGLSVDDVVKNSTVMASILSIEDHGCVMDLGIPKLRGFLPKKDIDAALRPEDVQEGASFLCLTTSKGFSGKIVQLTTLHTNLGNAKNIPLDATTINTFLPGTAVDVLVSDIVKGGLVGKVMGHLDVTADLIHSGIGSDGVDLEDKYQIGSRVKARVICNFAASDEPKLGISLLPHIMTLQTKSTGDEAHEESPLDRLPVSSLAEKCVVRFVDTNIGLFVDVGVPGAAGFVHISRVKDGRVDALFESSGPFQLDSIHRGRVTGYNPIDGLFLLSFEQHVLDQKYLRVQDVPVGEVVTCVVDKLVLGEDGVSGMVVTFADATDISGFVPAQHFADVRLQHPEKKFREGMKVKARVLSTDRSRQRIRLTLKKTLVNSELAPVKSLDEARVGTQILGWIVKVLPKGAVVRSYGTVSAWLPISEMSEAYISNPNEHFKVGQVVNVHVLEVYPETRRFVVSCKDPAAFGLDKQAALKSLEVGSLVSARVTQKTEEEVLLELSESGLKAKLPLGHLSDESLTASEAALKKIKVDQALSPLLVFSKDEQRRLIILSRKPSLVAAVKAGKLATSFNELQLGQELRGAVGDINDRGMSVYFPGNHRAWLRKSILPLSARKEKNYGFYRHQTVLVRIISVNKDNQELLAVLVESQSGQSAELAKNPLDDSIITVDDAHLGRVTTAQVVQVQETQLRVKLADNIPGRIDISQLFDSWNEIPDPMQPLKKFHKNEIIRVRIIGVYDVRKHNFLPISHRSTHTVLELSARPSDVQGEAPELLSYGKLEPGFKHLAFVHNVSSNQVWVHLTPSVRGKIKATEVSDNVTKTTDLEGNFPIGSAIRVKVLSVDAATGRLDLTAKMGGNQKVYTWENLKVNGVVSGIITKINERQVMVKLSETVAGPVHLPDMSDNYDEVNTTRYNKNEAISVAIVEMDKSNKRLRLSCRPSRVLSSRLPVKDREVTDIAQLNPGDIIRGFIKNVADTGVFVNLGGRFVARVKIGNLSDDFLKDWKDNFQVDQLVRGRILTISRDIGQIEMSLRSSHLRQEFVASLTYDTIKKGEVITGVVRKVQEYGVFIGVDGSDNISGLCHRSEMAEKPVTDATKLYKEGDAVKAIVLSVDRKKRRVSFGLKPSYFEDEDDTDVDMDGDDGAADIPGIDLSADEDEFSEDGGVSLVVRGTDNALDDEDAEVGEARVEGLGGPSGKYDWTANPFDDEENNDTPGTDKAGSKRRKNAEYQVDRTGELDVNGPQTATDFERLLLGQPDSSSLWIQYIALQMQVSELAKARDIAERAIKTINMREETEKLNVWIAYLNLEVAYGTGDTVEQLFKRACQYNNEQEVHERLASIYIQTGKHKDADALFQAMLKKFGADSPSVWTNYAHFLHFAAAEPERARALLPRATRALTARHHAQVTARFAALEFRAPGGSAERGRTVFEGLLAAWPRRWDLWDQLADLETGAGDEAAARDVFERGAAVKGLKARRAEKWFRRWAEWEEGKGGKGREGVMARAREWAAAAKERKNAAAAGGEGGGDGDGDE